MFEEIADTLIEKDKFIDKLIKEKNSLEKKLTEMASCTNCSDCEGLYKKALVENEKLKSDFDFTAERNRVLEIKNQELWETVGSLTKQIEIMKNDLLNLKNISDNIMFGDIKNLCDKWEVEE